MSKFERPAGRLLVQKILPFVPVVAVETTAVGSLVDKAEFVPFEAVTSTRMSVPTSPGTSAYELPVAPEIVLHTPPAQRSHCRANARGAPRHVPVSEVSVPPTTVLPVTSGGCAGHGAGSSNF